MTQSGKKRKWFRFSLSQLLIFVNLFGALGYASYYKFQEARLKANRNACWANQKTIAGGVEMYLLDTNADLSTLWWSEELNKHLTEQGYLRGIVDCPGSRRDGIEDGWKYYRLIEDGNGITCLHHGPVPDYRHKEDQERQANAPVAWTRQPVDRPKPWSPPPPPGT